MSAKRLSYLDAWPFPFLSSLECIPSMMVGLDCSLLQHGVRNLTHPGGESRRCSLKRPFSRSAISGYGPGSIRPEDGSDMALRVGSGNRCAMGMPSVCCQLTPDPSVALPFSAGQYVWKCSAKSRYWTPYPSYLIRAYTICPQSSQVPRSALRSRSFW